MSELTNNSNDNYRTLKSFWKQSGMDWIADLGTMKKAIVVRYYASLGGKNYYKISIKSWFSFSDEQELKRFDNYIDCCLYAESLILEWMQSIFTDSFTQDSSVIENSDKASNKLLGE